jgi:signal transduction histidine kinase/ActR/RegA family two-component response regulator
VRRFRDRPIREKVAWLVGLASVAGLLLAAAAVAVYDVTTFRPRAERDITTLSAILEANMVPAVLFNDTTAARENLATLARRPEIGGAGVFRPNGAVFARYRAPDKGPLIETPPSAAGLTYHGGLLVAVTPLESDGRPLGWLRVQYVLPSFWDRLPQYGIMAVVVLLAVAATAAMFLGVLARSVTTPLVSLADATRRLAASPELSLRVPRGADDEIGKLTDDFNRMLDAVQEREGALRESEARLRLALAAASMDTWVLPLEPAPSRPALERLLALVHDEDRPAVERAIDAAIAERGTFEVEFRNAGTDERRAVLRGQALADGEGAPAQLIGVVQDVTARRQLERQLLQAQKMEAIGNLAGGIAHDFNNLLTGMIGYLKFAQRALAEGSQVRADVDEVERAARRAAALTSQLLSYARRQMVMPTVVQLNDTVTKVEPLLRRLIGEDVGIAVELAADAWPVRIDPGQLEQVLVNLAVNSRDAMPEGGRLTIATRNVRLDRPTEGDDAIGPGDYVELRVSDTGTGIAPAARARIFEPFFTTKAQGQGTGLGLAVCYGIVRQAEGQIVVESAVGRGTTMRVLLPRASAPASDAATDETDDAPGGAETILLAEDDEAVRTLAVRTLAEAGYTVLAAPDAEAARAIAAAHDGTIDLLVADVVMPDRNGRELADELRRARPSLPVVFMSGYTEDSVLRRGVLLGETPFVPKPFSPAALRRAVRSALDAPRPAKT